MGVNDRELDKRNAAKTKRQAKKKPESQWRGFVSLELTQPQKDAVKVLRAEQMGRVWTNVLDMLGEGYKLSLSWDDYNQAFIASMTGKPECGRNAGLTLTARGGVIEGAVAALWYKHNDVLGGDWGDAGVQGRRTNDEDDVG